MIAVTAIQIRNYRVNVPGGYELLSGWTVARASDGALFTTDGVRPWLPRGRKAAAEDVAASGLLETAQFLRAS